MATIITKNSQTASAVPAAASLSVGELAVNTADGKLYTEHTGGVVKEIIPSTVVDGGITAAKIGTGAVTTTKIADANVTVAKLSASGTPSSSTFLRGDGSWAAAGGGSFNGERQVFTSSGTFTVPAGVSRVKVTVIGAGGNGGTGFTSGCACQQSFGGGGGAGGYVVDYVGVTAGGSATVTVGINSGTRTSSFAGSTTLTASGGNNGANGASGVTGAMGLSGAATIFGQTFYNGGYCRSADDNNRLVSNPVTSGTYRDGRAGVWQHGFGIAGNNRTTANNQTNVHIPIGLGSGGGGGGGSTGGIVTGGTGTNGLVIVEW